MRRARRGASAAVACLAALAACSDALDQDTAAGQVLVVANEGSGDVTLIDVTRFVTSAFGLAPGVPTSVAARGEVLIVALGDSDAVQVASTEAPGMVVRLADGSGATGIVIQNDSIAWVANPGLHTLTRLNYATGDTASGPIGAHPQAIVLGDLKLFVLNGNLAGGAPAGPSWITVRHVNGPIVPLDDSIGLTGFNARHATLGLDGLLYVIMAGSPGRADGRLAIVDPATHAEVAVLNGLGESPGPAVYHPTGRLLIASPTEGIMEVNTSTRSLMRGPGAGMKPEGDGVNALAVDSRGRVYAVARRTCNGPGVVHVLSAPPDYRVIETLPVGVCPAATVLAGLPLPD